MKVAETLFFVILFGFLGWAIWKAFQERKSNEKPTPKPLDASLQHLSVEALIEQLKIKIASEESKAQAGVLSSQSLLETYKEQLIKAEEQRDKYKNL